ncbi:hypothetical protein H1235_08055 [Pseudoxanthomonas sp. NC8]|nr:hypothetical protein H1235_08055 [Pseudoxanthomonas sp. NC8]
MDAFEYALAERFPDNSILSHDLLEGCYARAGLVSDVRLYEEYPERYAADIKRRARWIRGDWQLLPWLLPWVPRRGGGFERNPLSWLSRGKLLDNLRRSLVAPAAIALLLMGWAWSPQPLAWTAWVLGLWLLPVLLQTLRNVVALPLDMPWEAPYLGRQGQPAPVAARGGDAGLPAVRSIRKPAGDRTHAVAAAAQPSPPAAMEPVQRGRAQPGQRPQRRVAQHGACAAVRAGRGGGAGGRPPRRVAGRRMPLLLLWLLSPGLMAWLGWPPSRQGAELSGTQRAFLGRLARRTWAFFETWVRAEDHWLPPDNIQEHPSLVVARRTSPTNIGLSLLANLSAYDFGYVQVGAVMERTQRVFGTLEELPRHRGHFCNWYDTQTLQPLPPRYISTVDSGNPAGHLLTLRQGLLALADAPVLAPHTFDGLGRHAGSAGGRAGKAPAGQRCAGRCADRRAGRVPRGACAGTGAAHAYGR